MNKFETYRITPSAMIFLQDQYKKSFFFDFSDFMFATFMNAFDGSSFTGLDLFEWIEWEIPRHEQRNEESLNKTDDEYITNKRSKIPYLTLEGLQWLLSRDNYRILLK